MSRDYGPHDPAGEPRATWKDSQAPRKGSTVRTYIDRTTAAVIRRQRRRINTIAHAQAVARRTTTSPPGDTGTSPPGDTTSCG